MSILCIYFKVHYGPLLTHTKPNLSLLLEEQYPNKMHPFNCPTHQTKTDHGQKPQKDKGTYVFKTLMQLEFLKPQGHGRHRLCRECGHVCFTAYLTIPVTSARSRLSRSNFRPSLAHKSPVLGGREGDGCTDLTVGWQLDVADANIWTQELRKGLQCHTLDMALATFGTFSRPWAFWSLSHSKNRTSGCFCKFQSR